MRARVLSCLCFVVGFVVVACGEAPESSDAATETDGVGDGDGDSGDGDGDSGDGDGDSGDGDGDSGDGDGDSGDGDGDSGDGDGEVWTPPPGTTWQWQLSGDIDVGVDALMYDVDLFDAPDDVLEQLHADGRVVICYFSAGSHEDWRPDAGDYPPEAIGDPLDGWPGERWIDVRHAGVRTILEARLELARARGCDGVEPDNVDGYASDTGFPLTADDQLDFNRFLATAAHARNLSVGLKNDLEQIDALLDDFDWALDEECVSYDECELLSPFIAAGKAVFHVEYVDDPADGPALADSVCPATFRLGFSSLIKTWDLDAWRLDCQITPSVAPQTKSR
jgi:endo-alpha-1,4-polygalactosaminidase (GH114 family)